jgi:hypothetical protein
MMKRIVLVCGLWLSISLPAWADPRIHPSVSDLQADPESIGAIILGKKIKLMMRDGSYLEGKVLRAGPQEIGMRVKNSELKGASIVVQKGKETALKTSEIGMVYFRKSGSVAGPVALGVIGGILGGTVSAYVLQDEESAATGLTIFIAGAAGGATGGALLGREVVKKTVTIYVTPGSH